MSNYFRDYVEGLNGTELRNAVIATKDKFAEKVLGTFDWLNDKQALLYGDVQSGKTSHMLGLIADAADKEAFDYFLLLTSDNTELVNQTYERALTSLEDFRVINSDEQAIVLTYLESDRKRNVSQPRSRYPRKPFLIVSNKNASVLGKWVKFFKQHEILSGKALFIIDDEADAGSMNNNVNKPDSDPTAVNQKLTDIRHLAPACMYLQVTGTPYVNILQAKIDNWRPDIALSFPPGKNYIGGKLLFDSIQNNPRLFITTSPADDYRRALLTHLISSIISFENGEKASNMLVHPSHLKEKQEVFLDEAQEIVQDFSSELNKSRRFEGEFLQVISDLEKTAGKVDRSSIRDRLSELLGTHRQNVAYSLANSSNNFNARDWGTGINIIVGGNTLGRGLTIPQLNTVYYTRATKMPQADTLWQHARMFGYDRNRDLLRVFMPPEIAENFQNTHEVNENIKQQLRQISNIDELQVAIDPALRATRGSAVRRETVQAISGGRHYFPSNPKVKDFESLDKALTSFIDGDHQVPIQTMSEIMSHFDSETPDFKSVAFQTALKLVTENSSTRSGLLMIRRDREVRQGTGTLISPNDRKISSEVTTEPVLILYRLKEPATNKGWSQDQMWIPDIKLPGKTVYYCSN